MKRSAVLYRKYSPTLLFFALYTLSFVLVVRFLWFFLPFLLGTLFCFLLAPLCKKLQRKTNRSYSGIVYTVVSLFSLLFLTTLFFLLLFLGRETVQLFSGDGYFDFDALHPRVQNLFSALSSRVPSMIETLEANFSAYLPTVLPYAGIPIKLLLSVPACFIFAALTFIVTCRLLLNGQKARRFLALLVTPAHLLRLRHTVKAQAGHSSGLIFSYTLISLITFAEACVVLCLLQMPYPFLTALVLTVSDLFPVLGPGVVLFPLCIYRVLCGAYLQAIGLFAGWILMTVLRQIVEPRLISKITRTPGPVMLTAVYAALISGCFWLIPYTALLFYLYRLLQEAGLLSPKQARKKSRPS